MALGTTLAIAGAAGLIAYLNANQDQAAFQSPLIAIAGEAYNQRDWAKLTYIANALGFVYKVGNTVVPIDDSNFSSGQFVVDDTKTNTPAAQITKIEKLGLEAQQNAMNNNRANGIGSKVAGVPIGGSFSFGTESTTQNWIWLAVGGAIVVIAIGVSRAVGGKRRRR